MTEIWISLGGRRLVVSQTICSPINGQILHTNQQITPLDVQDSHHYIVSILLWVYVARRETRRRYTLK